jgi:hypothetical protein
MAFTDGIWRIVVENDDRRGTRLDTIGIDDGLLCRTSDPVGAAEEWCRQLNASEPGHYIAALERVYGRIAGWTWPLTEPELLENSWFGLAPWQDGRV